MCSMEGEFNANSLFIAHIAEMHALFTLLREFCNSWSFAINVEMYRFFNIEVQKNT